MTSVAFLTLIATVLAAEGVSVEVDIGLEAGIRPGDRAVVFYVVGEGEDLWRYEVTEGEVLNATAYRATLAVDPESEVEPGHLVRFRIPERRLSGPPPPESRSDERRSTIRGRLQATYKVRDGVFPCLNVRKHPAMEAPVIDCLPSGTRVGLLDETRGWKRVAIGDGVEGWTVARFLQVDLGSAPADAPSPVGGSTFVSPEAPGPDPLPEPDSPVETRDLPGPGAARDSMPEPLTIRTDIGLERELATTMEREAELQGRLASLEASLEESERRKQEQRRRIDELEATLEESQLRNAELSSEIERLAARPDPGEPAPGAAEEGTESVEKADLLLRLEALEERAQQLRDESFEARTELAGMARLAEERRQAYEAANLERETLALQVEDLEMVRERLETELAVARSRADKTERRAAGLEEELRQATVRVSDLAAELERNREALAVASAEAERLRSLAETSAAGLTGAEADRRELEVSLADAQTRARELEAARLELQGLLTDEVSERERLETENSNLQAELIAAKGLVEGRAQDLEGERQTLVTDLEAARAEGAELRLLLDEATAELESTRSALAESRRRPREEAGVPGFDLDRVAVSLSRCLRLRSEPSTDGPTTDCLAPGTEIRVLDRESDWWRIVTEDDRAGWVAAAFVESVRSGLTPTRTRPETTAGVPGPSVADVAATDAPDPGAYRVAGWMDRCLRLRSEPSVEGRALYCLVPGTEVRVLGSAPDWRRVVTGDDRTGWAAAEYLAADDPAGSGAGGNPGASRAELIGLARAWAEAWSDQDVDAYLDCYADGFRLPDGMSRGEWESARRSGLTEPSEISVELADLQAGFLDDGRGWVRFRQDYRSDLAFESLKKRLELLREGGGWKIVREDVER